MASNEAWNKIFEAYEITSHDFKNNPYILSAEQIKEACHTLKGTKNKEPRILCKQDSRSDRPDIFKAKNLFLLPIRNGYYAILEGEGYVDIPDIDSPIIDYTRKLDFELKSSKVGDSEMQFVDYAYANSLIRTFMNDLSLVLTIRGRKYTPKFSFNVGDKTLTVNGVQTEVDAGYEGKDAIVLIEAKNSHTSNEIIRQLYYPYRQWNIATGKKVYPIFFEKREIYGENIFYLWQFEFTDQNDYNSINLVKSGRYRII